MMYPSSQEKVDPLAVAPLKREAIDQWPIAVSGLPVRVINSTSAEGVKTVGQLRDCSDTRLLNMRSLGRLSLRQIHFFFELCRRIEKGEQRFRTLQEAFDLFLDNSERMVIEARYGFHLTKPTASRNCATLQEIGNLEHKTRERVRQIEDAAKQKLSSNIAQTCLEPFYDHFRDYVEGCGQVVATEDLASVRTDPILTGYNPGSIFLLLFDLRPEKFCYYRNYFSTLPLDYLKRVETKLTAVLLERHVAITLDQLLSAIHPTITEEIPLHDHRRVLTVILEHAPNIAVTYDGRFFSYDAAIQTYLLEVLHKLQRPAHYRVVTKAFNEGIKPQSRKGAGYILEMLNKLPNCKRVYRGIYDFSDT